MQGAQIPKSFKSVYSNGVSANTHVPALVARLQVRFENAEEAAIKIQCADLCKALKLLLNGQGLT